MRALLLGGTVGLTTVLGACATRAQARTEGVMPALDPPPTPPRVVAAYIDETPGPPPPPVAEEVAPPASRPPARPAPPRTESRPEPARSDLVVRPAPPSLTLTPAAGTEGQTENAIRNLVGQAARDLARVNVAALSSDGRAQFETARRFLQQADEALKAKNIVFAGKLADKAATLAAALVR
jgi:hypothetical protein